MTRQFGLFAFLVGFYFGTGVVSGQDTAPAPTHKEGDTWQINISRKGQVTSSSDRNEGTYEVVFAEAKVKVFEVVSGQKTEVVIEPDGTAETLLGLVGKSERRPDLNFPLTIGKKWNYEVVVRPAGARQDQKRPVEVSIVGQEQVTVPAGTFKSYKLVRTESWQTAARNATWVTSTSTFYYSPETRSIVKRVTENSNNNAVTTNELIKFTPGN